MFVGKGEGDEDEEGERVEGRVGGMRVRTITAADAERMGRGVDVEKNEKREKRERRGWMASACDKDDRRWNPRSGD